MGIVGNETPPPPPPGTATAQEITLSVISGVLNQYVHTKFFKRGHEYIVLESRRGTGPWEQIAQSKKSSCIDNRDLLVDGVAEVREYHARFWDNGEPTSDWCHVAGLRWDPRRAARGEGETAAPETWRRASHRDCSAQPAPSLKVAKNFLKSPFSFLAACYSRARISAPHETAFTLRAHDSPLPRDTPAARLHHSGSDEEIFASTQAGTCSRS